MTAHKAMKQRRSILAIVIMLATAAVISAHPLGNFSINQFTRIEPGTSRVAIRQVLDMAEIPTVAERRSIDTDADGACSPAELAAYAASISPRYLALLSLETDGTPLPIRLS